MNILDFTHFHLVGIKGVAMTALAQCLLDAGKKVTGSDVSETFVTQEILNRLPISIQTSFSESLPSATDCVIYTSAHNAQENPQVRLANSHQLPTLTHAEALGLLFNQKQGIAVCGVGGKSTTSAMIAWILSHLSSGSSTLTPSFAVGVGNIPGLNKTGQWSPEGDYFVAEADEYVTDPSGARTGENFVPRFSYLQPFITICTNLKFDHPDVYRDFAHTTQVYRQFFLQLKPNGFLIVNGDDPHLYALAKEILQTRPDVTLITYGEAEHCQIKLTSFTSQEGRCLGTVSIAPATPITLQLPGKFNMLNAVASVASIYVLAQHLKQPLLLENAINSLADFRSTKRRSEFIGEKAGVKYYDDYAHHPNEVAQIIQAFQEWYPNQRVVIGFQSHTFSRTKELLTDFVEALGQAREVVMIDIFASARENYDSTISSDILCEAVQTKYPLSHCQNLRTIPDLAAWCRSQLKPGDVFITVGAGDIYQVHQLIS